MNVRHEFRLSGVCPVDGTVDHYDVVVETSQLIAVERVLLAAKAAVEAPAYQEEVGRLISNRLSGAVVTLTGYHSGVRTVSTHGPGWENEPSS